MCKITTFFSNEIIFKAKTNLKLRSTKIIPRFLKISLRFIRLKLRFIFKKRGYFNFISNGEKMKTFTYLCNTKTKYSL